MWLNGVRRVLLVPALMPGLPVLQFCYEILLMFVQSLSGKG